MSGGFPCQPVSGAGKRLGSADERWMWDEYFRIISETRPSWVIIENSYRLLLIPEWGGYKPTWKVQTMKSNVSVYRLQAWVHRMSEKERLLLPTPRASQDYKPVRELCPQEKAGKHGKTLCAALSDPSTVQQIMLSTPCASDYKRSRVFNTTSQRHYGDLAVQAAVLESILAENLPTPTCQELKFRKPSPSETPQGSRRGCGLGAEVAKRAPYLVGKHIHPKFVEWMMGFPTNWTNPDCKLSGMQLCRESFIRSFAELPCSKEVSSE